MGIGNSKIASLQYGEAKNKFNVTIVTDAGTPVANMQVQCTTNGQNYETNGLGQIPQTIETAPNIKSIEFAWSTTSSAWTTIDGSLEQYITTTNNYIGIAAISSGDIFNGSCSTTVQTSNVGANYRINASATVENYVTIGTRQYLIVHVDSTIVYVVLRYWENNNNFGRENEYAQSTIKNDCSSWYSSAVPSAWRTSANAFTKVTTEGVSAECFIPTYSQTHGSWAYFNSNARRIFKDSGGTAKDWWTSSCTSDYYNYAINISGEVYRTSPTSRLGFRPALAIKRSLFTS